MGTSDSIAIRGDAPWRNRAPLLPARYLAVSEILAYCIVILVAVMGFLLGLISLAAASVLATILLLSLVGLSGSASTAGDIPVFCFFAFSPCFRLGA